MDFNFKVGISLTFRESIDKDESLKALVKSKIDKVEIGYVEYSSDPSWYTAVRNIINGSSVGINSVHAPFSKEVDISRLNYGGREFAIDKIDKAIKMAENLNAGIVVIHGSSEPINEDERPKRIAQCKNSLDILSEHARSSGVKLALELLPRSCLGNNADELEFLLADVDPKYAGFCLDTNHPAKHNHLDDIVRRLGKRIINLHISDYDGVDEKHWMPFNGVINWGSFANALRDIQYNGAFIYEVNLQGGTIDQKLEEVVSNFHQILAAAKNKEE